ncbi:hypothetical protein [Novipirellula artificiosorum]|uniref:Uncharacterized protein n=1 Tax=Novipirellula artificiosorum TaxID=2528016 RepID=A0A5C6D4T7_9BACT|nr:hypothetical protein [Novipirellula artificiosorum]TWU31942.1 hypothetical protein Poly41_58300 [Novipirellula artificiosorum]
MMMPENEPRNDSCRQTDPFVAAERQADKLATPRDQLLAQVLGETLSRRHEDPGAMLLSLRQWRTTLGATLFDSDLVERLVQQVLQYRMGSHADDLPAPLRRDVAAVLWNDPVSRQRIERLWQSLEPSQ